MKSPGFGFLFVLLLASAAVMAFEVKQVSASDSAGYIRFSESVYYVSGQSVNGTHDNTHEDDGTYHISRGERTPVVPRSRYKGGYRLNVHYNFTTGGLKNNQIQKLEVLGQAHTDKSSSEWDVYLLIYNFQTASWDSIGSFYGTQSDTNITWTYPTDSPNYTAPYVDDAGNMKLRWWFWVEDFSELWVDLQYIKLTPRRWTFMVYMAADGLMEGAGNDTVNEMEEVGSTSGVAVLAQLDLYATSGVKHYLVIKDNDTDNITSPVLWSHDELNMGDPLTLVDFVNHSIQSYPAEHYALILWNHGCGFRGVCYDKHPTDELNMTELKQALSKIKNDTGITFDLIGFDACLMGELEVAYQIKNYGQVMVGHEETGHVTTWPYDGILMNLTDNPTMSAIVLAKEIVTRYREYHLEKPGALPEATISAVFLANITELSQRASDLATALQQDLEEYRDSINGSRTQVQEYGVGACGPDFNASFVDVYHLAELLNQSINNDMVKSLCQQIKQAVNATIISEWHRPNGPRPNSHGITIYFQDNKTSYEVDKDQYNSIDFAQEYQWDEFLKAYLGVEE